VTAADENRRGKIRRDHPDTSIASSIAIIPSSGTMRRKVFDYLSERGFKGATDEQMQHRLHLNPSSQRPRRVELVEAKLVKDSGRRRNTKSGSKAIVWVLTKKGRKAS